MHSMSMVLDYYCSTCVANLSGKSLQK